LRKHRAGGHSGRGVEKGSAFHDFSG
jgi:hypothetical protein